MKKKMKHICAIMFLLIAHQTVNATFEVILINNPSDFNATDFTRFVDTNGTIYNLSSVDAVNAQAGFTLFDPVTYEGTAFYNDGHGHILLADQNTMRPYQIIILDPTTDSMPDPDPVPAPTTDSMPDPDPVPAPTTDPMPDPNPVPAPTTDPMPDPNPVPAPTIIAELVASLQTIPTDLAAKFSEFQPIAPNVLAALANLKNFQPSLPDTAEIQARIPVITNPFYS